MMNKNIKVDDDEENENESENMEIIELFDKKYNEIQNKDEFDRYYLVSEVLKFE